ncbi:MAG: rRNA small subunit methyltransferase 1, partial [Candidatus Poribacteria bacterium]|nr:rRNA small subunit methyltransferase 1 [Candidatus Poribacteria bacterium]
MTQAGTLYVVATPIGNLEDITFRAVRTLKEVDLIAAEDTRHTRKLLDHYDINTPLTSYHEHNERAKTTQLIERLADGDDIALVTDAGTPGISDPGYPLIRAAIDAEVTVVPIPGASAFV